MECRWLVYSVQLLIVQGDFTDAYKPTSMIRTDATEPMDIRAVTRTALSRAVFGAAKPHCAYLLASHAGEVRRRLQNGEGRVR